MVVIRHKESRRVVEGTRRVEGGLKDRRTVV